MPSNGRSYPVPQNVMGKKSKKSMPYKASKGKSMKKGSYKKK